MTFVFGTASREKLNTCHPKLITVAELAIELSPIDITIVWGFRPMEIQNALHASGASQKRYPDSKHNFLRSSVKMAKALDFAPWINGGIPWKDTHAFAVVAGVFLSVGIAQEIPLRWGGDWDMDGSTEDQTLMDWGHLELVGV